MDNSAYSETRLNPKTPKTTIVNAQDVASSLRLDASFFSGDTARIRTALTKHDINTIRLGDVAKVVMLSGFSIDWIPAKGYRFGNPMYSASAITEINPEPSIFISPQVDPNVVTFKVSRGWIGVTRSGTIGNVGIIYRNLDGTYLSNDAIRIIPYDQESLGFIYTFLSSIYGKSLLEDMTYGSVVGHIKTFQVESLPLPNINYRLKKQIGELIGAIIELRNDSSMMLKNADILMHSINGLSELLFEDTFLLDTEHRVDSFMVPSQTINQSNFDGSEYRLDAHFYNPLAQLAVKNLKACRSETKPLHEVTQRVFFGNRSKRNYVDNEHGIPFLSGKNIVQIRPELKYVSRTQTEDIEDILLKQEWTLVTRSGTIGRTCFVWKNYENYGASEHILRVLPDTNKIDPGYLYTFLSSKYGYEQILRYRHGSVIDEITDRQIGKVLVPLPSESDQKLIGDKVRSAYEKRAEAIHLEYEAQEILMNELTYGKGSKGE